MYDILYRRFQQHDKTIDALVEFIAIDNCPALLSQLDHKLEWIYDDPELCEKLHDVYDLDLLKVDTYDYLGDLYYRNQDKSVKGQKRLIFSQKRINELIHNMIIGKTDDQVNILDPCVGTGRFLLSVYKYVPNANLFGVDSDLRALRIAFTNCAIHNIKAYLLHADSTVHETDISKDDGRYNWQFANRWYSCMDKLKKINQNIEETIKTEKKPKELIQLKLTTMSKIH